MIKIRELQARDIMAIKSDAVEKREIWEDITMEDAEKMVSLGPAFTCIDNGSIVACYGGIKKENTWEAWAFFSNKVSCFTRSRVAVKLRKKIAEWKMKFPEDKFMFRIATDLQISDRYAAFLGATFKRTEKSKLILNVNHSIYEV